MTPGITTVSEKFANKVEDLRLHTKSKLDDVQRCTCPMVRKMYLNHQYTYWYNGYDYHVWQDDVHVFAANEIPYCYDNLKGTVIFQGDMIDLVNEDRVWPFLLFVDGIVVPWSKIKIIKDYDYSYIFISESSVPDTVDLYIKNFFIDNKDIPAFEAQLVYFPIASKKIRYGEDEDYLRVGDAKGLYFGTDGKILDDPAFQELSVRFEILDDSIYFRLARALDVVNIDEAIDTTDIDRSLIGFDGLEDGKQATLENILVFDFTGVFQGTAADIPQVFNNNSINKFGAYNLFHITTAYANTNPIIVQMYFDKYQDTYSSIYKRKEDLDKSKILNNFAIRNSTQAVDTRDVIFAPFDFDHYRDTTYDRNVRASMKYITQYDYALWNDIFIEESPIKSFTYTGREFKNLADMKSYVRFSRRHSELIEDVCMMFVNSKLYEHSIDISYTNNTINIPAFGILDDDVVEIVIFTECNNNVLDLRIASNTQGVYINPEYNLEDCYIMDNQTQLNAYDVPISPENRRQYICHFTYIMDDDGNYFITFTDSSHYNRDLKIVPKNQFRYYKYGMMEGQHRIVLPTQFNYCHDIDHYMIFVNGAKIDKTEYTITIMNENRPFDELVLYISTILDENDRVDVFYVPEYLREKYKATNALESGAILIKTEYPKMYALSKNTCMVFVNGLKMNPLDIRDVDMNKIMVNTKYQEIHNVTIVEYIEGSVEIARYLYGLDGYCPIMGDLTYDEAYKTLVDVTGRILSSNAQVLIGVEDLDFTKYVYDRWTLVYDTLITMNNESDVDGIAQMMKDYEYLTKDADGNIIANKNYKDDYAPLRAILYDIVLDYYVQRNDVQTGGLFTYDFEVEEFDPDPNYNTDVSFYPEHDKLLDYDLNATEATTQDVEDGKKFY